MSRLLNLTVPLNRYGARAAAEARDALERAGCEVTALPRGTDDASLAWIDGTFGGSWSSEAFLSETIVARREGRHAAFVSYDARGLHFAWLRGVGAGHDVGIFGPFGAAPDCRGEGIAPPLLILALCELQRRGYARALIPAVGDERLVQYYRAHTGPETGVVESYDRDAMLHRPVRTLVMASGNGTNFQAVLDAVGSGRFALEIRALVCDRAGAGCLERGRRARVPAVHTVVWNRSAEARAAYDARLAAVVEAEAPELILLLGWMHLLDASFVNAFPSLVNVHPAYLPLDPNADVVCVPDGSRIPALRGAHAIADAISSEGGWSGVTVHAVTPATDRGSVLVRKPLALQSEESILTLQPRIHRLEHALVPGAISTWLFQHA